jgi:hypothetical protein
MRIAACLGLAVALLPFAAFEGRANIFEKLLMPGEVIQGHAKYEEKCESCHEPFEKGSQLRLCLACHKDVRTDIESGKGFHGKRRDVKGTECKHCHTDHKGRGEDIVLLDKETFDHKATDFPLLGAHGRVKCRSCHAADRKYREAPAKCVACHKKQDPHRGRLGKACANCHTAKAWSKARFNHDKTRFSLKGTHKKVSCKSCHPDERYKRTPAKCADCHRLKDVHSGRYGNKCQSCHSPKSWRDMAFNHNKTTFPLVGKHVRVRCDSCHTGDLYKQDLPKTCFACHKTDDEHKGRNGKKCESCHTPRDWKQTGFNHDKKTKFPLKGGHAKLQCEDCHRGRVYEEKLDTACHSCHRGNDVHKGTLGKNCADCHNDRSWSAEVFFDHDLRRFPLIGLHATTSCEECHLTPAYEDTPAQCVGCHRPKDVHKSRLGPECGLCHNPNGWALWRFDHNTQTDYRLDGKHTGLNCQACHKKAVKRISLSTACLACHRKQDVHRGSFGKRCERCHTTDSFKTLKKFQ